MIPLVKTHLQGCGLHMLHAPTAIAVDCALVVQLVDPMSNDHLLQAGAMLGESDFVPLVPQVALHVDEDKSEL